jgi:hypothetical protein
MLADLIVSSGSTAVRAACRFGIYALAAVSVGGVVGLTAAVIANKKMNKRAVQFFETADVTLSDGLKLVDVIWAVLASSKAPKGERLDLVKLSRAVSVLKPTIKDLVRMSQSCHLTYDQCMAILPHIGFPSTFEASSITEAASTMHPVIQLCFMGFAYDKIVRQRRLTKFSVDFGEVGKAASYFAEMTKS